MGLGKWFKKKVVNPTPKRAAWLARQKWFHALVRVAAIKYGVKL
jgi:hypothetical protein